MPSFGSLRKFKDVLLNNEFNKNSNIAKESWTLLDYPQCNPHALHHSASPRISLHYGVFDSTFNPALNGMYLSMRQDSGLVVIQLAHQTI